jgi:hypothetical protein
MRKKNIWIYLAFWCINPTILSIIIKVNIYKKFFDGSLSITLSRIHICPKTFCPKFRIVKLAPEFGGRSQDRAVHETFRRLGQAGDPDVGKHR